MTNDIYNAKQLCEHEIYDDGYIHLSTAVCAEIAKVVVANIRPKNKLKYTHTRALFLRGNHERWFLYANLIHIYTELKGIFKACPTLQDAHQYMTEHYGYSFDAKLTAKEKICLENLDFIKNAQNEYHKTDKEVAEQIGVDRIALLRFKQKYKGGMWNEQEGK